MDILGKLGGLVNINTSVLLIQTVNFGILLWAMKRILYGPIMGKIKERDARIESELLAAQKMRHQVEAEQQAAVAARGAALREAYQHIHDAHQRVLAQKAVILQVAQKEAKELLGAARQELAVEVVSVRSQLRAEAATITIAVAERALECDLGTGYRSQVADLIKDQVVE